MTSLSEITIPTGRTKSAGGQRRAAISARIVVLAALSMFVIVPMVWMLSTAFKNQQQLNSPDPIWIPEPISWESFTKFFTIYDFGAMTVNSLITSIGAAIICTACACLAGYGITRFNFKGKAQFLGFLLVTQMFPSVMLVVPFYAVLSRYGMTNNLLGLVIVYAATNIAFSTWMMVGYFKTIPIELDEAARIDGASHFRTFWRIVMPLTLPGISAVVIFVLINCWNEYMYAAVLMTSDAKKTLTVGILALNGQYQVYWNDMMAAATVSCIPLVILFLAFQRYFIAGMTGGAVKS